LIQIISRNRQPRLFGQVERSLRISFLHFLKVTSAISLVAIPSTSAR
jgi:hypothetical protein